MSHFPSRMEQERTFWRLLADYEALTKQEGFSIQQTDMPSLAEAQRTKSAVFTTWHELGLKLGMRRTERPELDNRLNALAEAEENNLRALSAAMTATRRRLDELNASGGRLRQVQRNYQDGYQAVQAVPGFAARG